jgi:homoserine O-acetyltransferase
LIQQRLTVQFDEPLALACGGGFSRFCLAVEAYGALDHDRRNAVLVCHGLTGTQNAAGDPIPSSPAQPWWDCAIGPGKMIDTDRYFVVCANVLGGCSGSTGPASIDPDTGKPFGMRFPQLTIADIVDAQARLLDHLRIDTLHAAIGGSMGGFQVLEFARRHPGRLKRAVAICATPHTSSYTIALYELMRQAIYGDPAWNHGDYYHLAPPLTGLGLTAMIGSVLWLDRDTLARKFGRRRIAHPVANEAYGPGLPPSFEVEAFLARVRANASARFDPNSLIYLTKAIDRFDLADGYADLAAGVAGVTASVLLASYESDWRFPRDEIARLAAAIALNGTPVFHHHLDSVRFSSRSRRWRRW